MRNKNKRWLLAALLFCAVPLFASCGAESKSTSLLFLYVATFVLSLVLLIVCFFLVKKNKLRFRLLFSSVALVNFGYLLLALSQSVEGALLANRIAYLGSVFLPFFMLMILLDVTGLSYGKGLPYLLFFVSILVYAVTTLQDVFGLYYQSVSFLVENGVGTLHKVYGPLHILYPVFLFGYFSAMIATVLYAVVKKRIDSVARSVVLLLAVFVNLALWLAEQFMDVPFEMLSVSYLISEGFLLCLHLVMNELQRLKDGLRREASETVSPMKNNPLETEVDRKKLNAFLDGISALTPTEKTIYEAYVSRATTAEIMAHLHITENTLKYHNKNLYGKLGVSSRKELLECYKQSVKAAE